MMTVARGGEHAGARHHYISCDLIALPRDYGLRLIL
jgi:hypothetical protein